MHEHPHERQAMAKVGQQMCREMFSAKTMVDDLERVYDKALSLAAKEVAGGDHTA